MMMMKLLSFVRSLCLMISLLFPPLTRSSCERGLFFYTSFFTCLLTGLGRLGGFF